MVPNHGLIIFSLLYGDDDFQKSLMIVNTSGWDTDCNSGNLGCLLGIKNGLAGLDRGPDWRGPVADRLYMPTADGGRSISDAVTETFHVVNIGRALAGEKPVAPKDGARFHFELPGSVQGFQVEDSIESRDTATLENVQGHSQMGSRVLAIHYHRLAKSRIARIATPTFIPSKEVASYFARRGYRLLASPTLYSGQTMQARVIADSSNSEPVQVRLYVKHYDENDGLSIIASESVTLTAGDAHETAWVLPDTKGYPIAFVGVEIKGDAGISGTVFLDYLTWDGPPDIVLNRPYERTFSRLSRGDGPMMWKSAWVDGLDSRERLTELDFWPEPYRVIQNEGRGLLMQGTREWEDYQVTAHFTPHMCKAGGIGVRVQGMRRYYALLCDTEKTRLVQTFEGQDTVLAEVEHGWALGRTFELTLKVQGNKLTGLIDGQVVVEAVDPRHLFTSGAMALIAEVGRIGCDHVAVQPLS
jgi:hypothetical protein